MGGWVGRGWMFCGCGLCLFEDKNIYISSLSARSKFAIALSRINFLQLLLWNVEQRKTVCH